MSVEIKNMQQAILETIKELKIPERFHGACQVVCVTNALRLQEINLTDFKMYFVPFLKRHFAWIKIVDISGNIKLGDNGVKMLADLAELDKLETLIAEKSNIGDLGAQALATMTGLRVLNVCHNHIGFKGAEALSNMKLHTLDIAFNLIEDAAALALASSKTIRILDVRGNDIQDLNSRVSSAFARMNTLQHLNIAHNPIRDEGVKILIKSDSIHHLNIKNVEMGPIGKEAVAKLLSSGENMVLTALIWDKNKTSDSTDKKVQEALELNNPLLKNAARQAIRSAMPSDLKDVLPIVFAYRGIQNEKCVMPDCLVNLDIELSVPC